MKNFWKKLIAGVSAVALTVGTAQAVYILGIDRLNNGGGGSAPVMSACGGTVAGDSGSTDLSGTVTQGGTVTTCTITFGSAFLLKPACIVSDLTGTRASMSSVASTTAITITGITAADALAWVCVGKQGG